MEQLSGLQIKQERGSSEARPELKGGIELQEIKYNRQSLHGTLLCIISQSIFVLNYLFLRNVMGEQKGKIDGLVAFERP